MEKEYFFNVVKRLSKIYFTEILGICCMGNHFHLLVRLLPESKSTHVDFKVRYERYYGSQRFFAEEQIPFLRHKWSSLSELMKEIKLNETMKHAKTSKDELHAAV